MKPLPSFLPRWGATPLLVYLALAPGRAWAEPTIYDKETARALMVEGRGKLEAGDAKGALKAFQAAHALMKVPTTGLEVARAQAALGMLIEARTTATEVSRMPAQPGDPPAFTKARSAAEKLSEELAKRIPSLEIRVRGPSAGARLAVTLDGEASPAETLGVPRKVNPGEHLVTVEAPGYVTGRRTVKVAEGETVPLELKLEPAPAQRSGSQQGGGSGASGKPGSLAQAEEQDAPTWLWVTGAAGVVMLGTGVVFAVDYANARSTAASDCPNNLCDARLHSPDDVDGLRGRWNRGLPLALGFGLVGLGVTAFAGYNIFIAPRRNDARQGQSTRVDIVISAMAPGAAVQGVF